MASNSSRAKAPQLFVKSEHRSQIELGQLLSGKTVAKEFDVTGTTVRNWSDRGILPCTRDSVGRRLFKRRDVELLRQQRSTK
jgi:hypothetical protein